MNWVEFQETNFDRGKTKLCAKSMLLLLEENKKHEQHGS